MIIMIIDLIYQVWAFLFHELIVNIFTIKIKIYMISLTYILFSSWEHRQSFMPVVSILIYSPH